MLSYRSILLGAAILAPCIAQAQHDPQRNAVQGIAAERWEQYDKEMAKAEADDPETLFVQMLAALKRDEMEDAIAKAQAALDAGLAIDRLLAGPKELLADLWTTDAWSGWMETHGTPILLHGPMLGSVTEDSASFWVRTSCVSEIKIQVGDQTVTATPEEDADFTAVLKLDGLQPDSVYSYTVYVDGEYQELSGTEFRTYPVAGEGGQFSVGFGGGAGFVPKWEYMWDTIRERDPIAFLMLGDNVYIDQPEHSLAHYYCYYRRQSRPEWRQFVAGTSMYAIYDDHDFGDNDCIPGPDIEKPAWKREVWNLFRQNWVNPSYGGGEAQPGCWHDFQIGDVHFIVLDGRYYRDLKGGSMLGPVQKAWLKETLKASDGTFKVLCSPVPFTADIKPGSRDPWDGYPEEREEIFSFLETEEIEGVFLVAADRHRTDLRTTERPNGYTLYEFESSRLTNRHTHKVIETPGLIWGYAETCSFGLMTFDTTAEDPRVLFEAVTIDGEVVHDYTLKRSQLGF